MFSQVCAILSGGGGGVYAWSQVPFGGVHGWSQVLPWGGGVHAWSQVSSGIGEGYFQGVDMFGRAGIPGGRYTYPLPTPEMVPGIPNPLVLTPSGDHHNTYGWQAYWKAFSFCDNGMM